MLPTHLRGRRAGRLLGVVLSAAVAAGLASACGPTRMGAAAIVGDQRISTASLDSAVQQWQHAYRANPPANAMYQRPRGAQIPRAVLYNLIMFRVAGRAARDRGMSVSHAQLDQAIAGAGGQRRLTQLALSIGVPPNRVRDYARFVLTVNELSGHGHKVNARARQARVRRTIETTARAMGVRVNPRFGAFDYRALSIHATRDTLSRAEQKSSAMRSLG